MGHGTQVNGVQRDITGGMTLVNGVQRKITKGLTLVNGVQREIAVGLLTVVITDSRTSGKTGAHVEIDGVKYTTSQTIEVTSGTQMYCQGRARADNISSAVTLNGLGVATVTSGTTTTGDYTHTITKDTTVEFYKSTGGFSSISITE